MSELKFDDEKFEKKSGFYFTKDGAEFKKASIQVIKVSAEGNDEQVLTSNDINLSNLISMERKFSRVEITKSGFLALEMMA